MHKIKPFAQTTELPVLKSQHVCTICINEVRKPTLSRHHCLHYRQHSCGCASTHAGYKPGPSCMLARKADLQALCRINCINAHRCALDVAQVILPVRAASVPCEPELHCVKTQRGTHDGTNSRSHQLETTCGGPNSLRFLSLEKRILCRCTCSQGRTSTQCTFPAAPQWPAAAPPRSSASPVPQAHASVHGLVCLGQNLDADILMQAT